MVSPIKQYGLAYNATEKSATPTVTPIFTVEPSITVIKSIAAHYLPSTPSYSYDIRYFDEGCFNKLYEISPSVAHPKATSYLFRVALPLDPFYKTESEVATMTLLRTHTSIPVPKVVAYNSDANNELGFEWILMEKLPGECVADSWSHKEWTQSDKNNFARELAAYIYELRDCMDATKIGSLYFKGREHPSCNAATTEPSDLLSTLVSTLSSSTGIYLRGPPAAPPPGRRPLLDSEYTISRLVSPLLTLEKRVHLSPACGPFPNTYALLSSLLDIQTRRIQSAFHDRDQKSNPYSHFDALILGDSPTRAIRTCFALQKLLPHVFSPTENEGPTRLWHNDLSNANILVDKVDGKWKITGLIDWECASTMPEWMVPAHPLVFDEPLPRGLALPAGARYRDLSDEQKDEMQRVDIWRLSAVYDEEEAQLCPRFGALGGYQEARNRVKRGRAVVDAQRVRDGLGGWREYDDREPRVWREQFLAAVKEWPYHGWKAAEWEVNRRMAMLRLGEYEPQ